ncbi:MAG: alanyl-tRNA editing protein [Lachnospiraceae bacterium]|nr:alanyl-tRNA editing protein [Lachnospiraceae bacterium]
MLDSSTVTTRKLYYEDAYLKEFAAEVISAEGNDVVLNATAFFPEEGGQSADRGVLAGREVLDVRIRDGCIHHYLGGPVSGGAAEAIVSGSSVVGVIDWDYRFSNMQQHSGEHLFSGLVHAKYGYDNVGFHLSDNEVTMDFSGSLSAEALREIEDHANRAISLNIATQIVFLSGEEAERAEYRSKIDLTDEVRVVIFPGYDACACCAPHVGRSGEIGCLKVVGAVSYKGGTRVSMLCGKRAMDLFRHDRDMLVRTANFLTTNTDEVYESVSRLKDENGELKARLKQAGLRIMEMKVAAFPEGDGNAIIFEGPEADQTVIREAVNKLVVKRSGYCAVFAGDDASGYRFIIGIRDGDARLASGLLKERFGAKGGGKPAMVQGSVQAAREDLLRLFDAYFV